MLRNYLKYELVPLYLKQLTKPLVCPKRLVYNLYIFYLPLVCQVYVVDAYISYLCDLTIDVASHSLLNSLLTKFESWLGSICLHVSSKTLSSTTQWFSIKLSKQLDPYDIVYLNFFLSELFLRSVPLQIMYFVIFTYDGQSSQFKEQVKNQLMSFLYYCSYLTNFILYSPYTSGYFPFIIQIDKCY